MKVKIMSSNIFMWIQLLSLYDRYDSWINYGLFGKWSVIIIKLLGMKKYRSKDSLDSPSQSKTATHTNDLNFTK